ESGIHPVRKLEDLFKEADFISIHVPLIKATKHLINRNNFPLMKPEVYIINSSRGGIIHEDDLVVAVEKKLIAGAYLDVLEKEPVEKHSPLARVESIQLSPHIAGLTVESQSRTAMLISEEVDKILSGEQSICKVK